ncbi:TPA: hypothetical protein HA246_04955 [Candidatus Woesearchaeota archaeon]|nr:hypothetical protein [Candidatus Woesearchaeota archaeon]
MSGINKKESLEEQLRRKNIEKPVYWFKKLIGYLVLQELPRCTTCDAKLHESGLEIIADPDASETQFTVACSKMHQGNELSGRCDYVFDRKVDYEPIYERVKSEKTDLGVTVTINRQINQS